MAGDAQTTSAMNQLRWELLQTAQLLDEWAAIAATDDWRRDGPVMMERRARRIRELVKQYGQ